MKLRIKRLESVLLVLIPLFLNFGDVNITIGEVKFYFMFLGG